MPDHDNNPPKSPEQLELEKELTLAKLKSSIAQEQKGQLKGPDVTALQGNITSDGTFIESRILARMTLIQAFAELKKAIDARMPLPEKGADGKDKTVDMILYNAADIPCIELYAGLRRQLVMLDAHYVRVLADIQKLLDALAVSASTAAPGAAPAFEALGAPGGGLENAIVPRGGAFENFMPPVGALAAPGPVLAGYAVGAVLRTAIDLVSLFRVDTDYKNFDLPIDDTALAAEFRRAIPKTWKLWHPAAFPVNTVAAAGSELLDALEQVEEKNMQATSLLARVNDKIRQLTTVLMTEQDVTRRGNWQKQLNQLGAGQDSINTVNTNFTQVQGLLAGVDSTTKTTTMNVLLRAERLLGVMKKAGAFVVKLAAVSRGSNKVTKWLWSSAVIWHSAGTELNCLIFAPTGEIVFADTQLKYTSYTKAEDIEV